MKKLFVLYFVFQSALVLGQNKYLLLFKDKAESTYDVNKPEAFLSAASIARRNKQGIAITEQDFPVNESYLKALKAAGINVVYTSKWLNAALVDLPKTDLQKALNLPFVKGLEGDYPNGLAGLKQKNGTKSTDSNTLFDAGTAQNQLKMLGADSMHEKGFTGQNVLIGVFDSGFSNVDKLAVFQSLFAENRVKETYDFVHKQTDVYDGHNHGTQVLSCIAANLEGKMIGTAPDANFLLYITEDVGSETQLEEVNWLIAAERADSLGVDIISSSLGYTDFDGTEQDYTYAQVDGNTALITRAADWAASKGILVVVSAGNEGSKAWKYITPPADADSVIAVGAVDSDQNYVFFSSIGPTPDGRIKPEVAAKGRETTIATPANVVSIGDGTSYAAPLITGLVAGLRQAFPDLTAMQLRQILLESGSQSQQPDNQLGYGIPNFERAFAIARLQEIINSTDKSVLVFPNPVHKSEKLSVVITKKGLGESFTVRLSGQNGALFYENEFKSTYFDIPILELPTGNYFLKIWNEQFSETIKVAIQ